MVFSYRIKTCLCNSLLLSWWCILYNNYRPVSLLCVNTFSILNNSHFGFRKMDSTYMASMFLMNELITSLENDEYVLGKYLDFSKAFNTVDDVTLLKKLAHYGIRCTALKWFDNSYISNREQYVTYNRMSSSKQRIKCGVPQGSMLGPLLFIYILIISVLSASIPVQYSLPMILIYSQVEKI